MAFNQAPPRRRVVPKLPPVQGTWQRGVCALSDAVTTGP